MAKAKFDITKFDITKLELPKFDLPKVELPKVEVKFDLKSEAARPIYAGVGVTDLAVEFVRETVADVQKRFADVQKDVSTRITDVDLEPKALRDQAVTVVNARVDALSKEAKARRAAVEARVAELRSALDENVASVGGAYADLAKRGETLVDRIRKQESTQATVKSAATTTAKAKTTKTQATKATKTTAKKTAKKASTTAKKSSAAPRSSAKATATAAKKTVANAVEATGDAAAKVGA